VPEVNLEFIAQQRAEIERLTNLVRDLWEVQEAGKLVFAAMEKAQAEIERLKAENAMLRKELNLRNGS
jgi:hypothetical protein